MKSCAINGCTNRGPYKRGWCGTHYWRWREHGNPESLYQPKHSTPEDSFAARTEWQGECLVWTGGDNGLGYGRMRVSGSLMYAHRYAWERVNGAIPDGLEIDHTCHNPACCNVEHLRLADRKNNMANRRGAQTNSSSGVRNVYRHGRGWKVKVQRKGKSHYFGTYATVEEAARVATEARKALFGEFTGGSMLTEQLTANHVAVTA